MATSNDDRISSTKLGTFATKLWTKLKSTFYIKASTGIPKTDLESGVQTSLGKADTAIQPNDNVSSLTNDAGYLTSATLPTEIFWCTYGTTTTAEIASAVDAGKLPVVTLTITDYNATAIYTGTGYRQGYRFIGKYSDNRIIDVVCITNSSTGEDEWSYSLHDFVDTDGTSASGAALSGTWGIDISGTAATATTLATARTIGISGGATGTATSFNGSANITIPVTSLNATKLSGTIPTSCYSNTKVTQTAKTDNVSYPLLAASSASPTSGSASTAIYDTGVTLNPSTNTIAANISGNAASATSATSASSATKATNDEDGNRIKNTYMTLSTKSVNGSGVSNAAYVAPAVLCVRDGSAVTATSISGIVNACCSSAYRANSGRLYTILNSSSSSVTITGFAGDKSWTLVGKTFTNVIYWNGSYYREDN